MKILVRLELRPGEQVPVRPQRVQALVIAGLRLLCARRGLCARRWVSELRRHSMPTSSYRGTFGFGFLRQRR